MRLIKQKQFRIIRESHRDEDDGKVNHVFYLQELKYSWYYRGPVWKYMTTTVYQSGELRTAYIWYKEEAKAREHLKNLLVPVPPPKIIATK